MALHQDATQVASGAEDPDVEWLRLLVGDWQLIADLGFADLVLWTRNANGECEATRQCRPSTGSTVHETDLVGSQPSGAQSERMETAWEEMRIQREREPQWYGAVAVREEAVPVVRRGRCFAIRTRQTNLAAA